MSMGNNESSLIRLGKLLRSLRERKNESLSDVSGAVELDETELLRLEKGEIKPAEETLDLLIGHFSPAEAEEDKIWELAGYNESAHSQDAIPPHMQMMTMTLLPFDPRVVYSDMAQVSVNNYGVVMNFMQVGGNMTNKQAMAIARIGMSLEHAKSVVKLLNEAIEASEKGPKLLGGPASETPASPTN